MDFTKLWTLCLGNLIGIGGGSQVYRGETHEGCPVAVKLLNQGRPQAEEELLTDIEINSSLKHRHIVALLGYCVDAGHLILVYEFLPNGNLDDHLHGNAIVPNTYSELDDFLNLP